MKLCTEIRKKIIDLLDKGKGYKIISKQLYVLMITAANIINKHRLYGTAAKRPRTWMQKKMLPQVDQMDSADGRKKK